jgi:PAS domain S-box-containing protein
MDDRRPLIGALRADVETFRDRVPALETVAAGRLDAVTVVGEPTDDGLSASGGPTDESPRARLDRAPSPAAFDGPSDLEAFEALTPLERDLVWRLWVLDAVPFGLTLAGPAYQDTPVRYVNDGFERLTGYPLSAVRGKNLRLLQGPDTDDPAVESLREAVSIWEPITTELRNYRRDGTAFVNRVSLVPMAGSDGAVANWVGIQAAVDSS